LDVLPTVFVATQQLTAYNASKTATEESTTYATYALQEPSRTKQTIPVIYASLDALNALLSSSARAVLPNINSKTTVQDGQVLLLFAKSVCWDGLFKEVAQRPTDVWKSLTTRLKQCSELVLNVVPPLPSYLLLASATEGIS
jgi:hypothetical protein